ncbi:electron transfer flavoprotein alpha subunit [Dyadobacter jejuensis]|uniref:Electron transfer flavoprotein alpha subunit n=1 Tax=Dyadobacter jejuensis TaxID=1082580 RepID=A0A316AG07_9BACT|nr:electron transfer flavoprotein subunit alpha/FixB family protein [Dyadobacter jejuensis]PWJ56716.1 electron transfer flavoprotein alpha subunit [Dyadobacter jejuensis]
MSILVFIETENKAIKKNAQEAITYARAVADMTDTTVTALIIGSLEGGEASKAGQYGADKVLHVEDAQLEHHNSMAYASAVAAAAQIESSKVVILAKSGLADAVAARAAAKLKAGIVSGVTALPQIDGSSFSVQRSIFTGKAFSQTQINSETKILVINKNTIETQTSEKQATVEPFAPSVPETDFKAKVIDTEKATGDILLTDADIIVSGGRGMKGPEHWQALLDLASALGAATGCSKPVSDLDWRPHHEHIGQTGIKVAPNLYIACGISGAIQHLAGVNGSKCIVVINKDPEAPFFKAADYGIVGDVFEVLPKLTEAAKNRH